MRIIIVGGGIVGLSCAVALLADGHAVTVIDDDHDRVAASWGNAGHIATEQTAPLASVRTIWGAAGRHFARGGALDLPAGQWRRWLPFLPRFVAASRPQRFAAGQRALGGLLAEALPAWSALAAAIGDPDLVKETGHYVVWESDRTAAAGAAAWRAANTGTATAHPVAPAERRDIAVLAPGIATEALQFSGSGQIADLGRLAASLVRAITAAGGRVVGGTAEPALAGGRAVVPGLEADAVLVAAGARSAGPLAALGLERVPLIAERGYHLRYPAGAWPADMPPIVFEDRSMIVTRYADTVQAASFVEFGAVDAPPDPRKWQRLETHVRALRLPLGPPLSRWMGARPTLPDYLPAIGRSRRVDNLYYAFGHQHLGLTLAPVTAQIVAALARGVAPPVDVAPFAIERFGGR